MTYHTRRVGGSGRAVSLPERDEPYRQILQCRGRDAFLVVHLPTRLPGGGLPGRFQLTAIPQVTSGWPAVTLGGAPGIRGCPHFLWITLWKVCRQRRVEARRAWRCFSLMKL